jgi:hypothetical protein
MPALAMPPTPSYAVRKKLPVHYLHVFVLARQHGGGINDYVLQQLTFIYALLLLLLLETRMSPRVAVLMPERW